MENQDWAILQPYCDNGMRLLKRISQSIFTKFQEPIAKADYDDFYSLANMTLWQAYHAYDPDKGISFDGFLHSCLQKKFKSELTHRHRQRRVVNQFTVSLDVVNEDGEECSLLDFIPSDFDTFAEVEKRQGNERFPDKMQQYLSKLSTLQKRILNLLADGYKPDEIRRILGISTKEYSDSLQIIRSYNNVKILF